MVKLVFAALLAGVLGAGCVQPGPAGVPRSGVDRTLMDSSVRPQDDLFRHANGRWLKDTPMPADRAYIGGLDDVDRGTQLRLKALIEETNAQRSADRDAAQIADLYASFLDEARLDKLGAAPLEDELAVIRKIGERRQLGAALARLARLGVNVPLFMFIGQDDRDSSRYVPKLWQGGLGLPNRDYYLQESEPRFAKARSAYLVYLTRLLVLTGERDAEARAQAVLGFETELARVQWSEVENRDPIKTYNRTPLAELPGLAKSVDWDAWLATLGLTGRTTDLIVAQPGYVRGLDRLLESAPLEVWKTYATLRLLHEFAPYLGRDFSAARFAFSGTALQGSTEEMPRWERGVRLLDALLGESLGKRYVARHFPPAAKARIEALVANLLEAYRESMVTREWMGEATRREALAKLARFHVKVGYPTRWIDYTALKIERTDLIGNITRGRAFEYTRNLDKLGKPIDRDEWGMTPQTVNAYYDASMNEIVFPAAFLQPPAFDAGADDAANYGAIGAVIGHEISHGFDDEGSQYDGDGNLRDWWTQQDRQRFAARTAALVGQYSAFEPLPGQKVNGELTLGENIADNSGLEIAYKAWRASLKGKEAASIDGFSGDARFFLGWAQQWRSKQRDESTLRQIKSDPHTPDEFRVNGVVRNHPAYYEAFGVKPGDAMYLAPAERVSIW